MQRVTFRHLGREWEATIPDATVDPRPVSFRDADGRDQVSYEARIDAEELDPEDPVERELALRRGLESALVLDVLADAGPDATRGMTVDQVAERTGMPTDAAADRLAVLDSVQPVPDTVGTPRYRRADVGD